jgi:hypothetical protein
MHSKEEGTNGKLADGFIKGSVTDCCKLTKDSGSDCFLGFLARVSVGVAL